MVALLVLLAAVGVPVFSPPSELDAHTVGLSRAYGARAPGFNRLVLRGADTVQATAPMGGGYFIGIRAVPTESPIGYPLSLAGKTLIAPPRSSSYCSGASYAAFIEALNLHRRESLVEVRSETVEALRMQEPDGGRREDEVKAWGWWNADGFGSHFSLVQLMKAGERIAPENAQPGDFANISWRNGGGHSVVFLDWERDRAGRRGMRYWSSQTGTNGIGNQWVTLERMAEVCMVRATQPDRAMTFNPANPVSRAVKGDKLDGWQ